MRKDSRSYIRYVRDIRVVGVASVFVFSMLLLAACFPIIRKTDGADATAMPATSSIEITSTSTVANVDIMLNNENGTFAASDSDIAFDVTTNNLTGYTLMIEDNGAAGKLVNIDNNDSLDTLAAVTDANTFENGAADTYANRWGFKPSKYNSTANTNYIPAPTTSLGSTLNVTSCANNTVNCASEKDSYTIGVGARVSYAKPEGVYMNTFTLVAVANSISYSFSYLDNTSDESVANLPDAEFGNSVAISKYTIPDNTPTRKGYTFAGWCEGTITHVPSGNSTCDGRVHNEGEVYEADYNMLSAVNFYAMWNVNKYDITIKTVTGVSEVILDGVKCTETAGCIVHNLVFGRSYTLEAKMATGYLFSGWNAGDHGSIVDGFNESTQYIVEDGNSTIIPTTTADGYSIVIKTSTGISKVTLNGVDCDKESGCTVTNLLNGVTYDLTAEAKNGYTFSGWDGGTPGVIANISSNTTQYTIGGANSTITAKATPNAYTCYRQYRLQNADGSWGAYVSDGSIQVNYGDTCSYSKTVTEYKNASNGTNNSAASTSVTMPASNTTVSLDLYRNTYVCYKRYRLQGTGSNWGDYTSETSATVRWGDTCSYSKAVTDYKTSGGANNSTVSASVTMPKSDTTLSLDLYRNTFTCSKQYRLQGTGTSWGNYVADGSATVKWGDTCSYSKAVTDYKASGGANNSTASTSATMPKSNTTVSLDLYRNTFTCSKQYRLQGTGTSWGNYVADGSATVKWGDTCSYSRSYTDYKASGGANNSAASTSTTMPKSNTTLSLDLYRNTFTCSKQYRLQGTGSNWGSYTADGSATVKWGDTCSYSRSYTDYKASGGANNSAASTSTTMPKSNTTLSLDLYRNTFTCSKQYRLQGTGTSWGNYAADGSATVKWGDTCSYSKAVTNYKVSGGANNSTASTSTTMPKSNTTLYISLYRNTFGVTVNSGSGGGTYKWGDTVTIAASAAATGKHFTSWSVSGATPANASASSTTFAMPTAAVTATANYGWNTYTIKFNGHGADSGSVASITGVNYSQSVTLNLNKFVKAKYYFAGWNGDGKTGDTWHDNATVKVSELAVNTGKHNTNGATITLYAAWWDIYDCHLPQGDTLSSGSINWWAPPCKHKDRTWVYGKKPGATTTSGMKAAWSDFFSDGDGTDSNGSTKAGVCPAGFSGATNAILGNFIKSFGGTSYTADTSTYKATGRVGVQIRNSLGAYSTLRLDSSTSFAIWSRTQKNSSNAYRMVVGKNPEGLEANVYAGASLAKTTKWYVLCTRTGD